ncbi:TerD family protein, partial [Streptomyces hilarionis]|uniref:TerD family protein n=1 Tax=Streptomyces hilarionis TaxID=2839954 RepID=UPI00211A3FC3
MVAELVRGQNHPLSQVRLEIRVSAGRPVVAAATLGDESGRIHGVEWVAHPGAPTLPGLEVSRQAAADHRLAVDLDAVPAAVHRVDVLLALPPGAGGPASFGSLSAPFVAVTGLDGAEVASYTITGLNAESAVVALELYRRQGAWKVRAVGQGYAGGLAELLTDQGLPQAHELAAAVDEAVARELARSLPAPPPLPADGDRSRQTATSTLGPDQSGSPYGAQQGGPHQGGAHQGAHGAVGPYGATQNPQGAPGGPASADPDATQPAQAPTASTGGPIDYSHPRRQNTAPPPPPPSAPPA